MNLIKLSLIAAFFSVVSFSVQAQNVKPKFKKLIIIDYDHEPLEKGQRLTVFEYLDINKNGQVHNMYRTEYDTTYQLTDSVVAKLNDVFDGRKDLKAFMFRDKFPVENTYWGGTLKFISYIDDKGIKHDFIDVRPFMKGNFTALIESLIHSPKKPSPKSALIQTKAMEEPIIRCQNANPFVARAMGPSVAIKIDPPK